MLLIPLKEVLIENNPYRIFRESQEKTYSKKLHKAINFNNGPTVTWNLQVFTDENHKIVVARYFEISSEQIEFPEICKNWQL